MPSRAAVAARRPARAPASGPAVTLGQVREILRGVDVADWMRSAADPVPGPEMLLLRPPTEVAELLRALEEEVRARHLLPTLATLFTRADGARRRKGREQVYADLERLRAALEAWLSVDAEAALAAAFAPHPAREGEAEVPPPWIADRAAQARVRELEAVARRAVDSDALPPLAPALNKTVFRSSAAAVDKAEKRLLPAIRRLGALSSAEDAAQTLAEYALWRRAVRVALATALVRAIAYDEVWGPRVTPAPPGHKVPFDQGIYGTLGWELSLRVPVLAQQIRDLPAYVRLREVLAGEDAAWVRPYVRVGGGQNASAYEVDARLVSIGGQAQAWRTGGDGCATADRGKRFPSEFPPIPGSGAGPAGPDHMFARPNAVRRIRLVSDVWDEVRARLGVEEDRLKQVITAGSLRFGGAHPPHKTHRNGAMFDIDLAGLPNSVCEDNLPIRVSAPVVRRASESPRAAAVQEGADEYGAVARVRDVADLTPERLLHRLFPLDDSGEPRPQRPNGEEAEEQVCLEYGFPPSMREKTARGEIALEEVGVRYVQAALLTFPSQVLFASWHMLRDAKTSLIAEVDRRLAEARGDDPEGEDARGLAAVRRLLRSVPPRTRPKGSFEELVPDLAHFDHWHLSYLPDDVDGPTNDARELALGWVAGYGHELVFASAFPAPQAYEAPAPEP
jgi:hypothetical protein